MYIRNIFLQKMRSSIPIEKKTSQNTNKAMMAMYFLVVLNTICLGIQQVVLDHFTTDG